MQSLTARLIAGVAPSRAEYQRLAQVEINRLKLRDPVGFVVSRLDITPLNLPSGFLSHERFSETVRLQWTEPARDVPDSWPADMVYDPDAPMPTSVKVTRIPERRMALCCTVSERQAARDSATTARCVRDWLLAMLGVKGGRMNLRSEFDTWLDMLSDDERAVWRRRLELQP